MPASDSTIALEVNGITKRFSGVVALDKVSFRAQRGQLHAVIGENGAGKSTLMKILAGILNADSGEIHVDGNQVAIGSVSRAMDLGIALIHQELNLASNLDVGANIFLGREPTRFGTIDFGKIRRDAAAILDRIGLSISPDTKVGSLAIGVQQQVEIAKALSTDARIIIMDEPTSSLSHHETAALFKLIDALRDRGVTIVYISHRLSEIQTLADHVTVLRDGKNAGELSREGISHDAMVQLMVGRKISQSSGRSSKESSGIRTTEAPAVASQAAALQVRGLCTTAWPQHKVNLEINGGEIVGIAGLVGAGRTELLETIFGMRRRVAGAVKVEGQVLEGGNNRSAIRSGITLVPEDRKSHGLILEMGVRQNIALPSLWRNRHLGAVVNRAAENEDARQMIGAMKIKTRNDEQEAQFLSGGNQQKVVIGKWLAMQPKILLMDEPTRGVDVGAKQEIYGLMQSQAATGVAVLFVSSDMEEIIRVSDRVIVMHEGRITGELPRAKLSEEAIMRLATGALVTGA